MKDFLSFLKRPSHGRTLLLIYCLGLILFTILITLVTRRIGSDDTIFQNQIKPFPNVIDWVTFRYTSWSGRFFPEAFVYIFSQIPLFIWKIVSVIIYGVFVATLFAYYKLLFQRSTTKDYFALIAIFTVPLLIDSRSFLDGTFWVSGSMNYFWMVAAAIVALYAIVYRVAKNTPPHWIIRVVSLLGGIVAASFEQTGLVIVTVSIIFLGILFYRNRRSIPWYEIIFTIVIAAICILSLHAPGNALRLKQETLTWLPDFYTISLSTHVDYSLRWFLDAAVNHEGFLFIGIWLTLIYLLLKKVTKTWYNIGIIAVLVMATTISLLKGFHPFTYMFNFYPNWDMPLPHHADLVVIIPWIGVLLTTMIAPLFVFPKTLKGALVSLFIAASLADLALVTFSPTIYASGLRTIFIPSLLLSLIVIYLITTLSTSLQKRIALFIVFIATIQYIVMAAKLITLA
jgi:hypothetical protein